MSEPTNLDHQLLLRSAIIGDEDNWSGVADSAKRKKIQNRINQRSHRKLVVIYRRSPPRDKINILQLHSWDNHAIIRVFETIASHDRRTGTIRSNMLSSLSQFNFSRALMLNAEVFGLSADHMHDDACSLFVVAGPWPVSVNINTETLPHGLRPTSLQYRTEHHPWIDLLPVAQLRDNILERSVNTYDEAGLCRAFTGRGHGQGTGVIVWREPWDPSGWEVTAEFARSWGWVISGCFDLFRSTNMWRSQRGERPLFRSQ
ncbi:hypothetical protein FOC1_g10000577 [Fusarium oxysporum f. sp. cubense race 1]|uniref:Uncharacterized protein n=1 Tax=Fusarium oxysporum f. sp. cubense (strain race 1) TaxID=1229664 RepID=N4UKI0_FUSC1|nr:hypothetical protein FOC1_g10000577 [Fusarium oxysporum f. sp. cubense race 1]